MDHNDKERRRSMTTHRVNGVLPILGRFACLAILFGDSLSHAHLTDVGYLAF